MRRVRVRRVRVGRVGVGRVGVDRICAGRSWRFVFIGCFTVVEGGCLADYAKSRALDFVDCFSGSVTGGSAMGVDLKATDLLHVGLATGVHSELGFVGRRGGPAGVLTRIVPGQYSRGVFTDVAGMWAVDDVGDECHSLHFLGGEKIHSKSPWIEGFDLEVGAMFLVGVRAGVRPGQMLDFALGFVGVDLGSDDIGAESDERSNDANDPRGDRDGDAEGEVEGSMR